jgi:molybdopterin/thiamine biosynthesis adenylyltransferase
MLTDEQIERYSRQIVLPQVGGRGQEKLLSSSVALVATDELSSSAALYLAAAGVGTLSLGAPTAAAIAGMNPDCRTRPLAAELNANTAMAMVRAHDLVIGADLTPDASSLLNTVCMTAEKFLVWGNAAGCVGQVTTFAGHQADAPCYGCLHLPPPQQPSSEFAAMTAALVGTLVATEAIKILLGITAIHTGLLLIYDARDSVAREVRVFKDPRCATCSAVNRVQTAVG